MHSLSSNELVIFLTSISIMLIGARIFAETLKKIKLPLVLGEMIVGIVLGPTVLGFIFPDWHKTIFPETGNVSVSLQALTQLSVILLLFVAGLEVQLPQVLKQGKPAMFTSIFSMIIPFSLGFWISWHFPNFFLMKEGEDHLVFSLFFGTALSISALPVIARILMDLNLFKSKIGMLIIASAMFNDLLGWLIFSAVLALMKGTGAGADIGLTILYIIGFGIFMLTLGRKLLNYAIPFAQTKLSWPGGILGFSLGFCLLAAAFTEALGIHAILGAFIMGIAVGDSVHLHERAREIIHQFITNIFAPLFFVSIGLHFNFVNHFDGMLVLVICVLAFVGKIVGASIGAYMGGLDLRSSLAVGAGMNARGAMEIILSTLAFNAGIISSEIYTALVIMALLTSMCAGPMIRLILKKV